MEAETNNNYIPEQKFTDADSLKLRLDPSPIIFEIEKKLNGGYNQTILNAEGKPETKFIVLGTKLLNDQGIQRVINRVSAIVNQATVLGFIKNHDKVNEFMLSWHKDLRKELFINKYEYGITDAINVQHVINVCTDFVKLFLTRLIDRNEARALEQIHTVSELRNGDEGKSLFGFRR